MARNDEKSIRCSFCGKHQDQVRRIIAGPGAYICNECVQLCMGILDEDNDPIQDALDSDIPDVIPTPKEIHAVLDQYICLLYTSGPYRRGRRREAGGH